MDMSNYSLQLAVETRVHNGVYVRVQAGFHDAMPLGLRKGSDAVNRLALLSSSGRPDDQASCGIDGTKVRQLRMSSPILSRRARGLGLQLSPLTVLKEDPLVGEKIVRSARSPRAHYSLLIA